jgi:hypothetical protein
MEEEASGRIYHNTTVMFKQKKNVQERLNFSRLHVTLLLARHVLFL